MTRGFLHGLLKLEEAQVFRGQGVSHVRCLGPWDVQGTILNLPEAQGVTLSMLVGEEGFSTRSLWRAEREKDKSLQKRRVRPERGAHGAWGSRLD